MDSDIYNPCKQLQKSSFLLKNLSFARKAGEMTRHGCAIVVPTFMASWVRFENLSVKVWHENNELDAA